jgi:hypothetical protein
MPKKGKILISLWKESRKCVIVLYCSLITCGKYCPFDVKDGLLLMYDIASMELFKNDFFLIAIAYSGTDSWNAYLSYF